jgi:hypothetical protein
MDLPISPKYIYPDYGRINENGEFTTDKYADSYEEQKLGIFYDIYCVAIGKKPLAGVNLTTQYGIQYIKDSLEGGELNETNVKNIIKYVNHINLPCIQWLGEGNYLRNIYYNKNDKKGFENAMKLILILHTDYYDLNKLEYHIAIGSLLGYKPERIKGFLLRNINYREYVVSRKDLGSYIKNTVGFIKKLDFEKTQIMKFFPDIKFIYGCMVLDEL